MLTMNVAGRLAAVLMLAAALDGCVSIDRAKQPENWDERDPGMVGDCPLLEGTYLNAGRPSEAAYCDHCLWPLLESLDRNRIGDVPHGTFDSFAGPVEIRQPDADTLEIASLEEGGEPSYRVMRRDDDFSCNADGLNLKVSDCLDLGDGPDCKVGSAAMFLMIGMAGYAHDTASFSRGQDGSLRMHLRRKSGITIFLIPSYDDRSRYVRWLAADTRLGDDDFELAKAEGAAEPALLPDSVP